MMKQKKPAEEEAIIADRNYVVCFVVGFAFGVLITFFIVVLTRGGA